jgi:hypothetical protein
MKTRSNRMVRHQWRGCKLERDTALAKDHPNSEPQALEEAQNSWQRVLAQKLGMVMQTTRTSSVEIWSHSSTNLTFLPINTTLVLLPLYTMLGTPSYK